VQGWSLAAALCVSCWPGVAGSQSLWHVSEGGSVQAWKLSPRTKHEASLGLEAIESFLEGSPNCWMVLQS